MPIIKITAADIQKQKTLEVGWYSAQITKVSEFTTSKKGDSVNLTVTFLIDGTEGREIDRVYNSKSMGMIVPLIEAVKGKPVEPKDFDYDTSMLVAAKLDVKVVVEIYEGRLLNKIESYLPYGKGKEVQAPF